MFPTVFISCFSFAEVVNNRLVSLQQAGVTKAEEELLTKKLYPKREEFQWRPASILCKRFDLIDPYMGKVFNYVFDGPVIV